MSEDLTKQMPSNELRSILARLDTLEDKVDRRLQETRPIWERVLNELTELRAEINEVHNEINGVRTEMQEGFEKSRIELGKGMRFMTKRTDVLNHDILNVRADVRELDQRVTKLEGEPAP